MSKVNITVNNRQFTIACDDGQEDRVAQLGRYVDERFRELNSAGAAPNESYVLVLTALVTADEMFEARDAAEKANMNASQVGTNRAQLEDQIRRPLESRIAQLQAELDRVRREAQETESNVADFSQIRAEAEAREAQIAKVVDSLTDKIETAVKKLKRA